MDKNIEKFSDFELISELYRRFCQNSVIINTTILPQNNDHCEQLKKALNDVFKGEG